jgi:hypothetical protein
MASETDGCVYVVESDPDDGSATTLLMWSQPLPVLTRGETQPSLPHSRMCWIT